MALTKVKGSTWEAVENGQWKSAIHDFGAVGDGITDDTTALQAALDAKVPVYVPPGVYIVTSTLTFSSGSKLIGAGAWHGVRDSGGENYNSSVHTVIKSSGISGSNSCVVRLSKLAVGTEGTDFTPPGTDDLYNIRFEGITIDGSGAAEFGVYVYRLLDSHVKDVAVESCAEHGFYIIGSFTNIFEHMTAYSNEKNGWTIGYDIFSFSSTEQAVNACTFIKPVARYNGTSETYNQSTNVDEGHGFVLQLNRGNLFVGLVAESNDGAGLYFTNDGGNFGGPNKFIGGYIEFNQTDVVDDARGTEEYNIIFTNSRNYLRHFVFEDMFIHPDQGIWMAGTNSPTDPEAFLTFRNCYSTSSVTINSGSPNFRVENFSPTPTYSASEPNVQALSGAGAVDVLNYKTEWTTTGTNAATLADGVSEGQRKLIFMVSYGGVGTLTPTSFGDGTTMTFNAGNDFVLLEWINGNWWIIRNNSVVVA